ncbi:SDR family NAD(P)-dependent oxidoreductase [Collimonas silvisoli]|uniref:SDR family NAD(P)-dependent oxidoreductase n=1 Tax=Collimonas silvisoli TaxID=2825884 RepID=UPI001B8CD3E1|nr:SDR family oxidoreductase [Collimonas silvisoli]
MSHLSTYFPLANKVALITGAARGIALHIACALSAAGARLAILDVREGEGRAVAGLLGSGQGQAKFWKCDVSDDDAVRRVVAEAEAHFGRIDILVNSAGVDVDHPSAPGLPLRQWERAAQLNLNGGIVCSKHVLAAMVRVGGGSIVNVLSLYNMAEGRQDRSDYASTEALRLAGLNAQRYASCNIRVNSIQPGFLRPPALAEAMRDAGDLTQMLSDRAELQMLRESGAATDVAAATLYLVSDASRFVTGSELVIDAGYGGQ